MWLTGQIQLEALMCVVLYVSGLPKTFGNTQPSAKSQLLTRVWDFVAAPFLAIPLVKNVWGLHVHSVCAAILGWPVCRELERNHVKSLLELCGCTADLICVVFCLGRLLCF